MKRFILAAIVALLPLAALADPGPTAPTQAELDKQTHQACQAHRATTTGKGMVVPAAGYQAGWQNCAGFEVTYRAALAAAAAAAKAQMTTDQTARDDAALARLGQ